jgi:hypothetical protein
MYVAVISWLLAGVLLGEFARLVDRNDSEGVGRTLACALASVAGGALTSLSGGQPWFVGHFDAGSLLGALLSGGVALLLVATTRPFGGEQEGEDSSPRHPGAQSLRRDAELAREPSARGPRGLGG